MQSRNPRGMIYAIAAVCTSCVLPLLPHGLDAKALIPSRGFARGGLEGLGLLFVISLGWFLWLFLRDFARKAKKKDPL
jgi:hypothetical protein